MKKLLSCALVLAAAGCASSGAKNDVPDIVPHAQTIEQQQNASMEAKIDALTTSMTELLERLDVLNDRVAKLERIVNVSNLLVASTAKPTDAKAKHTYKYAPSESVVATCVASTFFSKDLEPAAAAPQAGRAKGTI